MDQPGLDRAEHRRALEGLRRINSISRSAQILWPSLRRLAQEQSHPLRILDLATGSGDIPLALARRAGHSGISIEAQGWDVSPVAIELARERARAVQLPVRFEVRDVLRDPLPADFDVITSSLFLHHLTNDQALSLVRRMTEAARQAVLVSDLRRTSAGYCLAWLGGRLLSRSPIVHYDAPTSVAAAFSMSELQELCRQAGIEGARVERRWPQRMLLLWRR